MFAIMTGGREREIVATSKNLSEFQEGQIGKKESVAKTASTWRACRRTKGPGLDFL